MHSKQLLSTIFFLNIICAYSQMVTTFTEGTPDDAIVLDGSGNIYCSNYMGDTVFKFTPSGTASSFVVGLNTPNGLAFNSNEELFVCDGQGGKINKYDISGNLLESFSMGGHPSGIIKSYNDGSFIFTLYTGNKIQRLEPDGTISTISEAPELNGPVGLAYDDNGSLYVGNFNDRKVFRVLEGGGLEYIATVGNASSLGFIAYGWNKLWGTVMGEHKIYTINPMGVDDVTLFAGSSAGSMDGHISEATFSQPNGIYIDEDQNTVYVTDFGTKNLRIISEVKLGNDEFDERLEDIAIYPNPISDSFYIHASNKSASFNLRLFDASGKEILAKSDVVIGESISTDHLSSGIYFLEITDDLVVHRIKLSK